MSIIDSMPVVNAAAGSTPYSRRQQLGHLRPHDGQVDDLVGPGVVGGHHEQQDEAADLVGAEHGRGALHRVDLVGQADRRRVHEAQQAVG